MGIEVVLHQGGGGGLKMLNANYIVASNLNRKYVTRLTSALPMEPRRICDAYVWVGIID